jgi:hypothetical protein
MKNRPHPKNIICRVSNTALSVSGVCRCHARPLSGRLVFPSNKLCEAGILSHSAGGSNARSNVRLSPATKYIPFTLYYNAFLKFTCVDSITMLLSFL